MSGPEFLKRMGRQLQSRGPGGGGPSAPKGLFAGTGLLIALVAGGFGVSTALFNGMQLFF